MPIIGLTPVKSQIYDFDPSGVWQAMGIVAKVRTNQDIEDAREIMGEALAEIHDRLRQRRLNDS